MAEFILGLLNSYIYDATTGACTSWFERLRKKRFEKKLRTEIEKFCQKNETTYINSGDFQIFLKYHKPLEKIMQNAIAGENSSPIERLYEVLVKEAMDSASGTGRILSVDDKRMIKDLCILLDRNIRQFYNKILSEQKKYIVSCNTRNSQDLRNHIDKLAQGHSENIESVKSMIAEYGQLSDYKAESIASLLSKKMWKGDFEEIEQIASVIRDRSKDLSLLLKIVETVYFSQSTDIDILEHQISVISNPEVRNCTIKYILPILYFRNQRIDWLNQHALGQNLKNIISAITVNDFSFVFSEEIEEVDHIETHKFVVNKQLLSDEPELSKIIVAVYLYKMKSVNTAQLMEEFWGDNVSWFVSLLIANRKIDILQYNSFEGSNKEKIKQIKDDFVNQNKLYSRLAADFQIIFYSMLLKASLCAGDEVDMIISLIPAHILHEKDIEDFIIGDRINKNDIPIEELLEYCKKTSEYWLLTNFIVRSGKSESAVQIIENHIELIDLAPDIFFIYLEGLIFTGREDKAKELLQEYESKYGMYFDYWNLFIKTNKTDEAKVIFVQKCKECKLIFLNRYAEYIAIERLIDLCETDIAYEYIKRLELQIGETSRVKKYKGTILQNRNKNIDALEIYKSIFDDFRNDSQVINAIITLSINMKREVDGKYIEAANSLGTPRMYLLAAAAYAAKGNIVDARRNNIKAILASDDYRNPAFMQYLGINLMDADDTDRKITMVEKDTAVYLRGHDGCTKIFCIYADRLLPSSPFVWSGDVHLYVEDVVKLGIYKLSLGATVEIGGTDYVIQNIETIDTYFAHHCFENVVQNGSAQAIMAPVVDGKMDVDYFVEQIKSIMGDDKEKVDWVQQYCNFEDIAMPLFAMHKFYNAKYTQFVEIILKDPSICIREAIISNEIRNNRFILSFASLIMLLKSGVSSEFINQKATYIPESVRIQVNNDIADIIERYSQAHAMSFGIYDGHPYTIQTEDSEKQMWMKEAGELKEYVDSINTVLNVNDLSGSIFDQTDVTQLFGIPDYDAMSISLNQDYTIISTEAMISSLKNTEDVRLDVITVTDWLVYCEMPWKDFIPVVQRLIEMGSLTAINVNVIDYLLNQYEMRSEQEKYEMLVMVNDALEIYNKMHSRYKPQAIQALTITYATVVNQREGLEQNEIMRLYARHLMRLHNIEIGVNRLEDGSFELVAYKLEDDMAEEVN